MSSFADVFDSVFVFDSDLGDSLKFCSNLFNFVSSLESARSDFLRGNSSYMLYLFSFRLMPKI